MRAVDWAETPLGPRESWPQSLCTAVSLCLGSRHPIVLWWGDERAMFYNDAYRPMLGDSKLPQFLGRSGEDCWAEIWHVIGPMMDQVLATGEATWSEDLFLLMMRHGYLEETYFTFSYSPIRDEKGVPRGIFNACSESTGRVLGERRLKALRGLAVEARTAADAAQRCADALGQNARAVPFALVYLFDETGKALHLGLEVGTPASPEAVTIGTEETAGWPFSRVAAGGRAELVTNLAERFSCLPVAPWDEPAHQALVLPIARPGSPQATGVLGLGINPRRAPSILNQAIMNLVTNALDAIKGPGKVTLRTGAEGESYVISVTDTGSGIPEAIRDRILEPFFTTKPVGQGTGLGLSITYSIVKRHGGDLELSPSATRGTVASIRIPRAWSSGSAA